MRKDVMDNLDDDHPKLHSYSLFDEESYIVWKPSDSISSPFDLSFSFRSSKTYSQLIVVEFDVRVLFFSLHVSTFLLTKITAMHPIKPI